MSLGDNVRRIRLQKGISQERLAVKSDLTTQTIYSIESGKTKNPKINIVEKIANGLDTTIEELTKK